MEHYWELVRKDGSIVYITPNLVQKVQAKMDARAPIHTKNNGTILYHEIQYFRPSDKLVQTTLLEEVAQAFKEPIFTDGGIASKWVKKDVPTTKWEKIYAPNGYARLREADGYVTVAWRLATHDVDLSKHSYCTSEEITALERKQSYEV